MSDECFENGLGYYLRELKELQPMTQFLKQEGTIYPNYLIYKIREDITEIENIQTVFEI